ncbi:WD40 repeat domain-containing protein [Candidatus Marithrix sp. Canyon 246]|uniref:WD40 repeat domain-containing protein n=1 Tax=Candidatus Marithrix sp. Canyon 246 TaxID=1827136 RepID=UPI00084A0721|nr:WD40 repeat domain-containing protein [Candidatus Marithrix sp. Canyon 246]
MSNFPYPGLRPFQSDEIDIFFGREQHVDQLITRLGQSHFLAVVGLSGSGKSSLVNTGLLADLKTGFLASAGVRWQIAQMRPGNRPFVRLSKALLETSFNDGYLPELTNRDEAELFLQAQLQRGSLALDKLWQSKDTNLLVFVDQFEEIFRYYDRGYSEEAEAFVSLLLASSKANHIYVVITMRSEFLGNCALFQNLPEAINESQFLTPRLSRDQLREAIVTPARVFDGDIDPILVNQLLNDAGNDFDQLPLLQHALMRMWHLSDKKHLTLDDYDRIGGFNHALSKHADEAYAELTAEQQHIAEILFKNLSERSHENRDTRRLVSVDEVAKLAEVSFDEVMAVVEVFRRNGRNFLMPPVDDNILDISHEALIRQWQRLTQWCEEEADAAKMYLRLQEKAEFWEKKEEALLHSPNLEMAIAWRDNSDRKPTAQWAARYGKHFDLVMRFLEASEQEHVREQQEQLKKVRQKVTFIGIGFLVSLSFAILAGWFGVQAQKAEQAAKVSKGLFLSDLSRQETEKGNTTNGILLALEALPKDMSAQDKPYLPEAKEKLYRAVIKQRERLVMDAHTDAVNHVAFSPNGKYLLTASADKTAVLWDIKRRIPIKNFNKHNQAVSYAGFSPDGSMIITASMDNIASLWDIKSGKRLKRLLGHKKGILHAAFSPDGDYVVTAGGGGNVRIWSVSDGKLVRVLKGHNKAIFHISFNANTILTTSLDKTVRLWDFKIGKPLKTLMGHEYGIYYAAFSPDGNKIVTASMDNTARLWSDSGELIHILKGHTAGIFHAAFSPDGLSVVTSSMDNTIRLWSVETGQLKKTFSGHKDWVSQAIFNLDGSKLISVSKDTTVRIWDAETGNHLNLLAGHNKFISQVVLSPDGKHIATASMDNTARLWDINNQDYFKTLIGHKEGVRRAIFSPNGKLALTSSWDKTASLWDVKTGKTLKVLAGHKERVYQSAFSPNGKLIVTGSFDNTARLWNAKNGNLLHVLKGHGNVIYDVAINYNNLRVITASWDKKARLWDVKTGKLIKVLSGHKEKVVKAKFSKNGKYIITISDTTAKLWNADSGIFIKDFIGHDKVIKNVAFNSDSSMIVTSSKDHTARIWNVETGDLLKILNGHKKTVYNTEFSPDGSMIATSSWDDTARLWEVKTGKVLHILTGHKSDVYHVSFSPDGNQVITASKDQTARVWDVETGKMLYLLDEHKDIVAYAEFSPDSKSIITASKDNTANIWHLFPNTQELINYANKIVPRHLTNEQRKDFFLDYKKVIVKKEVEFIRQRQTSRDSNTNKPHFCNNIEEKAEAFICHNPLLWEIENQNYNLYHGLIKDFTKQAQDKFKHQYLIPWLHNIRNPQCEQSVPLCLQVYEQRIKELKSKFEMEKSK